MKTGINRRFNHKPLFHFHIFTKGAKKNNLQVWVRNVITIIYIFVKFEDYF